MVDSTKYSHPVRCCSFKFKWRYGLIKHMQKCHAGDVRCSSCDVTFAKYMNSRNIHIVLKDIEKKKIQYQAAERCQKFMNEENEKRFKCEICGFSFESFKHSEKHQKTCCHYCKKNLDTLQGLKKHIKSVLALWSNTIKKCAIIGKKFIL